jgi:DNA repair photolyase
MELIGIAKLAAQSPTLEAKRRVEYFELSSRRYISVCDSPRMPFRRMINPYRGCEFGCKYCYARYTHEFMELRESLDFERKIYAKHFDSKAFRAELRKLPPAETIAIGTATDPYQPAERRFRVTRGMLEELAATAGFRVSMITKSDMITRDIDVLKEVARRHYLTLTLTITTLDRHLARLLEPMAPRPDLRVAAVRKLAAAGLRVTVNCAPILPLLNDGEPALDALAKSVARAGAAGLGGQTLFLKDSAKSVFFPFLQQHLPHLLRRYQERYGRFAYLTGSYPETVAERLRAVRKRYGLDQRSAQSPVQDSDPGQQQPEPADFMPGPGRQPQPELWPQDPQLRLF